MDVVKLAALANLPLSSAQQSELSGQMDHILEYVSQLQQVKVTTTIEPAAIKNRTRVDEAQSGLPPQPAFIVPGILETE